MYVYIEHGERSPLRGESVTMPVSIQWEEHQPVTGTSHHYTHNTLGKDIRLPSHSHTYIYNPHTYSTNTHTHI